MNIFTNLSPDQAKSLFRRKCFECHPDTGGSHEAFIELQNQYKQYLHDNLPGNKSKSSNYSNIDLSDFINEIFKNNNFKSESFERFIRVSEPIIIDFLKKHYEKR